MNTVEAFYLAQELMEKHGLIDKGWTFTWSRAKKQFGVCRYRTKEIRLSRPLTELNDREDVRDTILHEIAHALTPGAGHGWQWKMKAKEIGAKPNRCFKASDVNMPSHKIELVCGMCLKVLQKRHKRMNSERLQRCSCRRCGLKSEGTLFMRRVA